MLARAVVRAGAKGLSGTLGGSLRVPLVLGSSGAWESVRSCGLPAHAPIRGMAKASKGAVSIKTRRDFVYYPDEAMALVKACATAKFNEVSGSQCWLRSSPSTCLALADG
jgi:hypothetical protein